MDLNQADEQTMLHIHHDMPIASETGFSSIPYL
jgi:hypothetical protein